MIFTDDLDRKIKLNTKIQRIISLVPSITELLFDLELSSEIIACTNYCIHPKDKVKSLLKIGGTKDFDLDKIRQQKPDLIIAVKEENNKDLVLQIAKEFPTVVFDIVDLNSALNTIKKIGRIVDRQNQANNLLSNINTEIINLKASILDNNKTSAYLIWNNPMMGVGVQTYISDMMRLSGFINVFDEQKEAYFELSKLELEQTKPHYIFLSSEPFKFTDKHRIKYQKQYPKSKVVLVDGEMFSWYGSRILKAISYFSSLQKMNK